MSHTPSIGVLLVQLGTPQAPTPTHVRRYLAEFLSDPRVVDLPRLLWWPLLHGIILRTRPARSAKLYQHIWRADGVSPLLYHTQHLHQAVNEALHPNIAVGFAMRYGQPTLPKALDTLLAQGVESLLVVPLYPQYAASTTASVIDATYQHLAKRRFIPTLRFARPFFAHPTYLNALTQAITTTPGWSKEAFHLFSFHGLPQRHVNEGDPYATQCRKTAQLLATALKLPATQWRLTFQSRFGREPWLEPATNQTLAALPKEGVQNLIAICPGFVADCLETLEEIAMGGKKIFISAGGSQFTYIPCLNDHPAWTAALIHIIRQELAGWMPNE
ncbi:MAG: ferrochelatase [Magnetococcus sp. DMHC-6]